MRAFPLLDRPANAVLFRSRDEIWTGADFLRDVARVAPALPNARWIVNCCENRYWFAVVLAAGLLRGQPNLLASDHSPASLAWLGRLWPDAVSVSDTEVSDGPFPHHRVTPIRPHEKASGRPVNPEIPGDRVAAVVFTSGTTGEPTAHIKPWGGLVERTRAGGQCFGFTEDAPATVIGMVPQQHMYGFETTLLMPLHAAVASWSDAVFYPADARAALAATRAPRILVTTPLQLRALVDFGLPQPPEMIISATAPLAVTLAGSAETVWATEVHEIFGATEVGSIASRRTTRDTNWTMYPGVSLQRTLEAPLIRAPFLEPRSLSDDIEVLDDNCFRLIGRGGDLVKLGGRRASHAGLNHILTRIDGVEDGIFVVPEDLDRHPSARLLAFVVAPHRSAPDILAELRARIDAIFLPRRIIRVESLPRNRVGKLTREALNALLESAGPE
ncbi:MAG: hypothetical protein EXR07_11035 [Acetobacteraceae bacterium]|nr:hypothetical protein [Acetobacteraceae bacterium]